MDARKRLYNTWYGMINRRSGNGRGRGRYIDPEWEKSFEAFASEMGEPPTLKHVLCMHDPDAGFYPGNAYWGTRADLQQYVAHSKRIIHNGELMSISEAARREGIHRVSMRERLERAGVI